METTTPATRRPPHPRRARPFAGPSRGRDSDVPAAPPRTPPQQRVWSELLAADACRAERPAADPGLGARLSARILRETAAALDTVPDTTTIWLSKTALGALRCDGRYLDHLATPFTWSPATAAGQLAHTAVQVDLAGGRTRSVPELVEYAWRDLATRPSSAGAYLSGLHGVERDALHAATVARCLAFRDCFPQLPPSLHPRTDVPFTWRLSPRLVVKGVPDLLVGRPDPERRLVQLVELKTGDRRPRHRDELALYALLTTVKHGMAPFRVATYYLDEADWDACDVTVALLEAAADRLVADVERAVRLTVAPPKDAQLSLRSGPDCRWCSRAPDCPLSARELPNVA